MENQQPAGEAQNSQKNWYATWWGVILIIMFLPFFAIWYIWAKTKWNAVLKGLATFGIVIATIMSLGNGDAENKNASEQKSQQAEQAPASVETKTDPAVDDTPEIKSDSISDPEQKEEDNILLEVSRVVDGDTIDVDMDGKIERIRLIGIDTPETVDPRKVVQCFGKEASDKAKEMLDGKMVSLEADSSQGERDSYDRLLRYVYLEDGTFFNKYMIAEGYAHEYTYQSNPYKYQSEFQKAEKQARETTKGLWSPESCNGNTTQSAIVKSTDNSNSTETASPTPATNNPSGSVVKKSKTGICHAPGTTYYNKTLNFTPYSSIDECLKSGGRLPKR